MTAVFRQVHTKVDLVHSKLNLRFYAKQKQKQEKATNKGSREQRRSPTTQVGDEMPTIARDLHTRRKALFDPQTVLDRTRKSRYQQQQPLLSSPLLDCHHMLYLIQPKQLTD